MRFNDLELGGVALASFVVGYVCDDWIGAASVAALWLSLKLVSTHDRLFVLPIALCFHWSQVSLGVLYKGFTGREVLAHYASNYRPMVLIGLGCVLALSLGIHLGFKLRKPPDPNERRPEVAFGFPPLLIAYVSSIFVEGSLLTIAPDYTSFRQLITTMDTARLGILYLVLRRFCAPPAKWGLFGAVVATEIVLGITGFFAGFREPLILAVLATLEIFDRHNSRHWMVLTLGGAGAVLLGLVWMGIRGDYRAEYVEMDKFANSRSARVERVRELSGSFLTGGDLLNTTDALVDRMWTIYFPALAVERVPSVLPHTDGAIFGAAVTHVLTPRIFFPNKGELMSDSDMVRKYSNVQVAGREHGTSIAFGYAAESYIDYGIPWMFLPVLAFGVFLGFCYALFRQLIWHRELFVAFATVTFWLSAYLFERDWANTLGVAVSFMVYLGTPVVLLDRFLMVKVAKDAAGADRPMMLDEPLRQDRF